MHDHWISERAKLVEVSGIRKVFDLAAHLRDPVNLSIGQPQLPLPAPIKNAAHEAIDRDQNGYTITQGIAPLRSKILADVNRQLPGQDRDLFISSGTSGGLMAALLATVNPGDEVVVCDPY